MLKIRQAVHVWYDLSCGHTVRNVLERRENTGVCPYCPWPQAFIARVFILATHYEKPLDD